MHASLFGEPLDDEMRTALRSELEEAQSRWRQGDVGAYRVEVEHWTLGITTDYRLQVEGDSVTSAVRIPEGSEPHVLAPRDSSTYRGQEDSLYAAFGVTEDSVYSAVVSRLPTVRSLFRSLEWAVDSAFSMVVEYDPALGYPRSVAIDYSANVLDDEVRYSVQELEVMEGR